MGRLHLILWFLFCSVLTGSAYELRVWEDVDGNQFEGRFLRELFGKLTVEVEGGGTKTFRLEQLSELDQKYLRVKVPPEMEVTVKHKAVDLPSRPQGKPVLTSEHVLEVEIIKKSQRPFTSRLKAEIFLIGEEVSDGDYVLMDKTDVEFILPTISKGAAVVLKSKVVQFEKSRQLQFIGGYAGQEYEGYLVVISTVLDNQITHIESSLPSFIEDPEVIYNLRELYIEGAGMWISRLFDKTGKKIPPPRPPEP